jgi:O-antigen/teichoic acid export membrane protein
MVHLAGGLAFFAGYYALRHFGVAVAFRFLDPLPLVFLYFNALITCMVFCLAIYLRAHRQEPLLVNSLVVAALISVAVLTVGPRFGADGIAVALFVINLAVSLPWVAWVFYTKRRQWHAPDGI